MSVLLIWTLWLLLRMCTVLRLKFCCWNFASIPRCYFFPSFFLLSGDYSLFLLTSFQSSGRWKTGFFSIFCIWKESNICFFTLKEQLSWLQKSQRLGQAEWEGHGHPCHSEQWFCTQGACGVVFLLKQQYTHRVLMPSDLPWTKSKETMLPKCSFSLLSVVSGLWFPMYVWGQRGQGTFYHLCLLVSHL